MHNLKLDTHQPSTTLGAHNSPSLLDYSYLDSRGSISDVFGMVVHRERQLIYHLASQYKGIGEIVELGCFVGLSTTCFAKGLADNQHVSNKTRRINTFDWFKFFDEKPWNEWLRDHGVSNHHQLINLFLDHTKPWSDMIALHPGDLMEQRWDGRPIEILFIDAGKNWTHNDHIVQQFYPSLIPGHSTIVHQDYIYWHNGWVAVTMEWFADCFEIIDSSHSTVTFKLVRPIPIERLQKSVSSLPDAAKLALMDRAIARTSSDARPVMLMAKANLLAQLQGWQAAKSLVEEIEREHGNHPKVRDWLPELSVWQSREAHKPFPDYLLPDTASMGSILWRS